MLAVGQKRKEQPGTHLPRLHSTSLQPPECEALSESWGSEEVFACTWGSEVPSKQGKHAKGKLGFWCFQLTCIWEIFPPRPLTRLLKLGLGNLGEDEMKGLLLVVAVPRVFTIQNIVQLVWKGCAHIYRPVPCASCASFGREQEITWMKTDLVLERQIKAIFCGKCARCSAK